MNYENIRGIMADLRHIKERQNSLTGELASEISSCPEIVEGLKAGIIRLNFPAPIGFINLLRGDKS